MVEHKMQTIDGIRYRPEDAARVQARRGRQTQAMSTQNLKPTPTNPDPFDPGKATVEEVLDYLGTAEQPDKVRVLDAEAAGKERSTILSKREEILGEKEDGSGADSGGDAGGS